MIDPLSQKIATQCGVTLEEVKPNAGDIFGVWQVLIPGSSDTSFWFWSNKAFPDGTIVLFLMGGQVYRINGYSLLPIQMPTT